MVGRGWCEHDEKVSKYTELDYRFEDKVIKLRVQSWFCPECGMHGSDTQVVDPMPVPRPAAWTQAECPVAWMEPW